MDINKVKELLVKLDKPKFYGEEVRKAIFVDGVSSFLDITFLPKTLREIFNKEIKILSFEAEKVLVSKDGQSIKALLKLSDGYMIETVLIAPKPDSWSACISCQVGCQMGCKFCATGKMGFKRDLTAEEITDQILFWRQYLKTKNQKLSNIVFMGMGEPFANWENVKESLKNLIDPKLFGIGARNISVSTSGVPDGIEKLAEEFPQVNLALSLHFADDRIRSEIMPINRKYGIEDIRKSLRNYFVKTNRKVFLEYVMLENINDSFEDADKLIKFVKSIGKLQLLHVNLIRYNATGSEFESSSKDKTLIFKDYLFKNRIPVTIRKSLGEEIQGACGQLAGK